MNTTDTNREYPPLPSKDEMKNWTLVNSSEASDDEASLRYLKETEADFLDRGRKVIMSIVGGR